VYIHLHPGLSEYTRKSPCIFTLNQNHSCPFLTVYEYNAKMKYSYRDNNVYM
jgi:hypothetical protein